LPQAASGATAAPIKTDLLGRSDMAVEPNRGGAGARRARVGGKLVWS
jgi:hypothetical protein